MDNCETPLPASGLWDGYEKVGNSTCSFCAAMCKAPAVNSAVGFFDGFNGKAVLITYIVIVSFSIAWYCYMSRIRQKAVDREWDELKSDGRESLRGEGKIN